MSNKSNMDLDEFLGKPKALGSSKSLSRQMPAKMRRTEALKRHINSQRNSKNKEPDFDLALSSRVININFDVGSANPKSGSSREAKAKHS